MRVRTTVNFEYLIENFGNYRGIVLPGGTRSTKSVSALQYIMKYCFENVGKEIIIGRDTLANLKKTTLNDFKAVCYGQKGIDALYPKLKIWDPNNNPRCEVEGNLINFHGLNDDIQRTHGMDSDLFYLNEAVSINPYCFKQLNQRNRDGWILDCNPSEPNSWVYKLEQRNDVGFYRSTYDDNPFLTNDIIREIEGYKPTEENIRQGTANERMWSVYGKGEVYKGSEIIYSKWETFKDYPNNYDWKLYGLDWGWTHPLAVVEVVCKGNNLYWKQIIYKKELELDDLITEMKLNEGIMSGECYVVCDSAEPRSINRLVSAGIPAIKADKKGGSVMSGIRKIQSMNLHIHEDSYDLQNEANNYKFKVDSRSDTVLEVPVKENDDGMDAGRYPTDMFA